MDFCKIGGRKYNVLVTAITENFNILYSDNSGRTLAEGAEMVLDPLGVFYGHKVTFKRRKGFEKDYDELFDFLSKPRFVGIDVELVHNQETISYKAYVSNGERAVKIIDEKNNVVKWGEFSVNIIPMKAQVLPE